MTENNTNKTKQNPARRSRGGGGRGRGGRNKNYASEGDALSEMPTPSGSYPATPIKIYTGSPAAPQSANPRSTNKKNFKKNRQNNLSTTPDAAEPGHRTPPATDPVAARLAFAGSSSAFANSRSFHSPAPNTLPRPVFPMNTKSETITSTSTRDGASFRDRSESASVRPRMESSLAVSDSEAPSPSHHTGARIQEIPDFSFGDRFHAERIRLQKNHSAHAAVPFSAPSRPQAYQLNDNPIPFSLPQRPAQRVPYDTNGASDSAVQPDPSGNFIRQSMPHARHSQPHMDYCSPPPVHAQTAPPNMQHFSPQHAQARLAQPHGQHFSTHTSNVHAAEPRMQRFSQHEQSPAVQPSRQYPTPQQAQAQAAHYQTMQSSPHHTPAHVNQQHQHANTPPLDPSDALKNLLWSSPASTRQAPSAPASGHSHNAGTPSSGSLPPSSGSAPSSGPHLRGGGSVPVTSASTVGGPDNRKSLAEDALRKVLGLSFPLSMSTGTGFDGNHSPQRYSGHA